MYNRYIPEDTSYTMVTEEPTAPPQEEGRQEETGSRPSPPPQPPGAQGSAQNQQSPFGAAGFQMPAFLKGKEGLTALFSGKERGGLTSLLKSLHLENIDTGDILLLLIILYLLVEGDDLELVIALGLVLIMGLGDRDKDGEKEDGT